VILGLAGNDYLYGLAGNDRLDGGTGADVMAGGTGNDTYYVDDIGDVVWEWGGEGHDVVYASVSYTLLSGVERLELKQADAFGQGSSAVNGTGNELNNVILGNSFSNVLSGLAGDDELYGGDGQDRLYGGDGNDILHGGLSHDQMFGGRGDDVYHVDAFFGGDKVYENADEGIDTVKATANYRMDPNVENLELIGVLGHDGWGNELGNTIWGNEFDNIIRGEAGNDTLYGFVGIDILDGGTGDDILDGGTGRDSMQGGAGNDTYVVDDIDEVLENLNSGIDTVRASVSFLLPDHVENLELAETATNAHGVGNNLDNVLRGNSSNNALLGGAGRDTIDGGGGNDRIEGGDGADTMFGGDGADILEGGAGFDIMNGEAGADTFTFRSHLDSLFGTQEDQLPDFSAAEGDKIDLSQIDASTAAGEQAFSFIGTNVAFNGVAGELRFNASYVEGDIDGNGIADFSIAVNASSMVAADFIL
jgi:Ca2+-binding RTX toxin-like protein